MTKYVVSGYIGFDNFGDEAIAKVLIDKLRQENAEKITLISYNPKKTAELYGVNSCEMLKFLPEIINSDVLISGGGSLLQDVTSIKSLLYYLSVIYSAYLFGKEVEIFAQGIGPIKSKIGQFLTKIALKNASKITIRDIKSQELLKSWGISSELVKDPIFSVELPQKHNTGTVGVQLRSWNGADERFLENLAKKIQENFADKTIEILSLQDSADLEICKKFSSILKKYNMESNVYYNLSVNEIFEKITELEYLVAMRFHAGVAGIKAGVKTLMINYDPKVQKLAEEYNLPLIEINSNDFSKEFDKLLNK